MLIDLGTECIRIDLRQIIYKDHTVNFLQILEDQLVLHYSGQELCFSALDGDNVLLPALVGWIQLLQRGLNIPDDKICFVSVSPSLPQWRWIPFPLEAFEETKHLLESVEFDNDTSNAKFVGVLTGSRWSTARMRMAYELDKVFADDAFITYSHNYQFTYSEEPYYQQEINWARTQKFNNDITGNSHRIIDWRTGLLAYVKIWNQFQIEVICETDEYQNQWFTDKTAKCLCTGKPFLLLSGQHSLQNLKQMGFVTFDQWIDESYDECVLPAQRIRAIINSLQKLHLDPSKSSIIADMQEHAKKNINYYSDYVQKQIQLRTHT
jgi:hypothetical protein